MDNVIRSASMKQRQRVTQKQCRHTHTLTHTNTYNTHARKHSLARSLSPSPKTRVWSEGRSSLSFYDKCSPILYARGSGHRGCASQLYYNHFKAIVFLLPKLFIIHLLTHVLSHTHTRTQHTRARLGKGEGKNENQLGDEWPSITKYTMAENTEKEENLQKPKPANENARLHQFRIIT